jgi:hypothetical protein
MGKANVNSNNLLKLIFNATAIANIADNAATAPLTNLYVALHTADPGAGGTQSTSEITYTSYARVAVARTTGGWTASAAQSTSPVAAITFPAGTGGAGTATFFSIGVASSGATAILYSGAISPSIVTGNGVTPQLTTATTITEA